MKIPSGKTEAEVLAAIEAVANRLAPSFVFGYYDVEDIKQECRVFCVDALQKGRYDCSRPLENFLYVAVRHQLLNLQRNKKYRNEPPCMLCHGGSPCGKDGACCERYTSWKTRNQNKANILSPLDISQIADEKEKFTWNESTVEEEAETAEILRMIDEQLPAELRGIYLQMRAGVSIPKAKRLLVENAVKEILRGAIECPSEAD
jgi:hypothetical protein